LEWLVGLDQARHQYAKWFSSDWECKSAPSSVWITCIRSARKSSLIRRDEELENIGKYNFDHPDAFDWPLARQIINDLSQRKDIIIPNYNYKTCKRDLPGIHVKCTDLILFEGIFALYDQ
jgi:hypothetical protein